MKNTDAQTLQDTINQVETNLHLQTLSNKNITLLGGSITDKLDENNITQASVAVIKNGEINWSKSYGDADQNTLFQCASIGKAIAAIAALQLVEKNYISLDEPVNNKLKRYKIEDNENTLKQQVTLRHLLSHTAGLTDGYGFLGYEPEEQIPTLIQILNNEKPAKGKKSLAIKTIPGTVEKYSGAGYVIIQLLIEDLTGLSFDKYVEQNIFIPANMKNTTYSDTPDISLNLKVAEGRNKSGSLKGKKYNVYPEKAAAGPWTTARDLALLIIELQKAYEGTSDTLLSKQTAETMLSKQINHKGLGVNLKGFENIEAFWHAGQNLGYTALMYGTLQSKSGAVVMLNSDNGDRLMQAFITSVSCVYNWPVMRSYRIQEVSKAERSAMLGSYVFENERLYIKEKNGQLYASKTKKGKGYLFYRIGENHYTFQKAQDYYKVSFADNFSKMSFSEGIQNSVILKKEEN